VAAIAVVAFGLGRWTAPDGPPAAQAPTAGSQASPAGSPAPTSDAYVRGVAAGEALGVQEGRALQAAAGAGTAAPDVRRAFDSGYAAGANDVFSGYDGGFAIGTPYVITLEAGRGGVTYRIATREQLEAGATYRLCPDGHEVCRS
jgi:hypothetical protein